jgi:hypothetical protein
VQRANEEAAAQSLPHIGFGGVHQMQLRLCWANETVVDPSFDLPDSCRMIAPQI